LDLSFFFQADGGIRDFHVTGVQTCALPIFGPGEGLQRDAVVGEARAAAAILLGDQHAHEALLAEHAQLLGGPSRLAVACRRGGRSEERRVGNAWRSRWWTGR